MPKKRGENISFQAFLNDNYIETFESFNLTAMKVVSFAIEEALAVNSKFVTFDLLLLGVIRKGLDSKYNYLGAQELIELILKAWRTRIEDWEANGKMPSKVRNLFGYYPRIEQAERLSYLKKNLLEALRMDIYEGHNLTSATTLRQRGDIGPIESGVTMSSEVNEVFKNARGWAKKFGHKYIGMAHIVLGMADCKAKNESNDIFRVLDSLLIEPSTIISDVLVSLREEANKHLKKRLKRSKVKTRTKYLDRLCVDLTSEAYTTLTRSEVGRGMGLVIGRTSETSRVVQIFGRKSKNNPCLVGEPGVGKTAVAEGLAQHIVNGNVPDFMKVKVIMSV
jgi:hypothetical protein